MYYIGTHMSMKGLISCNTFTVTNLTVTRQNRFLMRKLTLPEWVMKEIQRNALTYFEVDTVFDCIECMRCSPSVSVAPPTLTTAPAGTFSLFHAGGHHVTSWLIEFQSTKLINFHVSQLNEGFRRIQYFKNYSTGEYTRTSMKETRKSGRSNYLLVSMLCSQ